jgi:hypothetical protein
VKSAIKTLAKAGGVLYVVVSSPALWAQGQQMPTNTAGGYNYPAPAYGQQYQQPNYSQAQSAVQPDYAYPQAAQQQGYAYGQSAQQPNYGYGQATQQPGYTYGQAAQQPAYGYGEAAQPAYQYQYGQSTQQPTYGYGQSYYGYGQQYSQQNYAYQPSYRQPGYSYQQPYYGSGYTASPYSYYSYPQQGYNYSPMMQYPGYGSGSTGPFANAPWDNLNGPDIFGSNSPFEDPLQHEGYWAKKGFHPWRSGPFAYDKWTDHPGTKLPWGNFPGWGDGFFGGFGPDQWEGVTPWGNDVPFKWFDPTDPEESIAEIWEDALNTPNRMGRMPPGFTAPYISVPNPIDVENEFERNAQIAPDEIHNMWGDGANFGGDSDTEKSDKDKDKTQDGKQAGEKPAQDETQTAARNKPQD